MRGYVQFNKYTHTHTHIHTQVPLIPPWEDQCEWHRMTRMTGPDCVVMCNLINTHTHTHTHTHTCMLWNERAGRLTGQSLGPLVANRVDLGSFSSRCCTFRRTHTSADSTRLLCIRLALPFILPLPSQSTPSERLTIGVRPRALWLAGIFLRRKKRCAGVVGTCTDWVLKGEGDGMTPLLQSVARFHGGGEILGFGWGGYKESRPWCSLFVGFPASICYASGE